MLFSSFEFIFGFLPITLVAFHVSRRFLGGKTALGAIIVASFAFYGWWNLPYLLLLILSIFGNFLFAKRLTSKPSKPILITGVVLNLAVLGYFKYRNFFLENITQLTDATWELEPLFIPLAISFFTFQQIAFIIDVNDGRSSLKEPVNYIAFVTLFPQLIAGPIVLYREIDEQFKNIGLSDNKTATNLSKGTIIFTIGLFKKVALADSIAPYADTAFALADKVTLLEAWAGAIAYSFQLYFDFSGYSDMAVGLGLMLGIQLPFNFDVPFRSTSMVEFWKRWHITLTRFFMMYFYSPIALKIMRWSSERDLAKFTRFFLTVTVPISLTFLLSGLWHGPDWTFIYFGAVNAIGLIINQAWRELKLFQLPGPAGWVLTMVTVIISFVYFRAASLTEAHAIISVMFDPTKLILPNWLSSAAETLNLPWQTLPFFASGSYTIRLLAWIVIMLGLSIVPRNPAAHAGDLDPSWKYALVIAFSFSITMGLLDRPQAFIYFQF